MLLRFPGQIQFPVQQRAPELHVQRVHEIFHGQKRPVEQFFSPGRPDGDEQSQPFGFPLFGRRPIDPVFFDPKGLAAIHQRLGVGADGVKENGRGDHQAVRGEHGVADGIEIIPNGAAAVVGFAFVDFQAGRDFQVAQDEFLDLRPGVPGAGHGPGEQGGRVALPPGTSVNCHKACHGCSLREPNFGVSVQRKSLFL